MAKEFNKRKALLSQCRDYFRSCLNGYSKERFQPFTEIQTRRLMGHNKDATPNQTLMRQCRVFSGMGVYGQPRVDDQTKHFARSCA